MKKVIILIIFLFLISMVYAAEVIEEDIGDYSFYQYYNHTPYLFIPIQKLTYIANLTDLKYKVQVIEFNDETFDSENLDGWITTKTEKSEGTLTFDDNIIFINEYDNIVMWRSGNAYVQVTDGRKNTASSQELVESLNKEGEGGFPTDIIDAYLDLYPSDCGMNNCRNHDEEIAERRRVLNQTLNDVNDQLMEKRLLMREEEQGEVIAPSEIRKDTVKTARQDEQIEPYTGPDVVTSSGPEADNEPESEKDSEGKEDLIKILVNWLKTTFPNLLR